MNGVTCIQVRISYSLYIVLAGGAKSSDSDYRSKKILQQNFFSVATIPIDDMTQKILVSNDTTI